MSNPRQSFPTTDLGPNIDALLSSADFSLDHWLIHGNRFEFHTDEITVRQLAKRSFRFFSTADGNLTAGTRLCLTTRQHWTIPLDAEVLPPSSNEIIDTQLTYGLTPTFARLGEISYFELAPLGGVAYDFATGQALGYLEQMGSFQPQIINNLFLQTIFLELLRGRGLFWVHAACVADGGRGALLIGHTGSGKTTTCLNLIQAGFKFLSQDRTFIRVIADQVELLGFPEDLAVTQHTLDLLPGIRNRLDYPPPTTGKRQIDPASLFPDSFSECASPGLILFLRVTGEEKSSARSLSSASALQRILPNSLLASQPEVSRRHFDALARLVMASKSHELRLGRDVDQLPDLVRSYLRA